ncbi:hypothetical protein BUALT_Bualt09G0125600 [Buddleja alternifolia]|uniref:Chaperone DnaJ C-terminal domain-containing protein n=1 Tax=Buddleja alternifolia TaxID=168488 RepID=A0AAV6XA48_9LAMI|nr:hypothetical protein BUALT_Bualt09G0125600 [Buddleja alternifolia]
MRHHTFIPSDLVVIIDEKPQCLFKRDGNDLIATHKISLVEAMTGCTARVNTLDDRNLTIPVNNIVNTTYEEVVKGEGMPIPKRTCFLCMSLTGIQAEYNLQCWLLFASASMNSQDLGTHHKVAFSNLLF